MAARRSLALVRALGPALAATLLAAATLLLLALIAPPATPAARAAEPGQEAPPPTDPAQRDLGAVDAARADPAQAALAQTAPLRLRVLHAIPDAPPLDVYVNRQLAFAGLSFFGVSRYLGPLAAGSYLVELRRHGSAPSSSPLLSRTLALSESNPLDYSLAAVGTLSTGDSVEPALRFYGDTVPRLPPGFARLSATNVAPGAAGLNILINGSRVLSNVTYPRSTGYLTAPAGVYTVSVAIHNGSPLYTTRLALGRGDSVTLWASGVLTGALSLPLSPANRFALRPSYDNAALVYLSLLRR